MHEYLYKDPRHGDGRGHDDTSVEQMASYIPPLKYAILTPIYDLALHLGGFGTRFRQRILAQTPLHPDDHVLDVACGTGAMSMLIKQQEPATTVTGIDLDEQALSIARRKAAKRRIDITYKTASADSLPFPDASFNMVTSTLAYHHFPREVKENALKEAYRVLRPQGYLVITDFGKSRGILPFLAKHLEHGGENVDGQLPTLVQNAGFSAIELKTRPRKNIDIIVAVKP